MRKAAFVMFVEVTIVVFVLLEESRGNCSDQQELHVILKSSEKNFGLYALFRT